MTGIKYRWKIAKESFEKVLWLIQISMQFSSSFLDLAASNIQGNTSNKHLPDTNLDSVEDFKVA